MDGFLNILKPPGMSSHDVVAAVRRVLSCRKVGHGGTLDPAAAGVLPVAVGRATRFIEYVTGEDKEYLAEVRFGTATDSGDITGQVTDRRENFLLPPPKQINEVLTEFHGAIRQRPPLKSAIKIDGRPAYKLVRRQETTELPEREVCIKTLQLTDWRAAEKTIGLRVVCAKGTYIRSLAVDIAAELHLPATLSFLLRSRVGNFTVNHAVTLDELATYRERSLLTPEKCLTHLTAAHIPPHRREAFINGLGTTMPTLPPLVAVYANDEFLGVGGYDSAKRLLKPLKVWGVPFAH